MYGLVFLFKVLVSGTGMFFAIKWLLGLGLVTFAVGRKLGLDLTF